MISPEEEATTSGCPRCQPEQQVYQSGGQRATSGVQANAPGLVEAPHGTAKYSEEDRDATGPIGFGEAQKLQNARHKVGLRLCRLRPVQDSNVED